MGTLNRVLLIGHVGKDAEINHTKNGTAVVNFSLATSESWKDREGVRKDHTEWHKCTLWGKMAEALGPYLVKGKHVCAEGSLETRKWEDKDGVDRYTTEIKVRDLTLLGGGKGSGADDQRREGTDEDGAQRPVGDDETPPF